MLLFAGLLLWASPLGAAGADCPGLYRAEFQRDAGISERSWSKMCAGGADPKEFYVSKRIVKTDDGRTAALAEWYLGLDGVALSEADLEEFKGLDAESLPDRLKDAYLQARGRLASRKGKSAKLKKEKLCIDAKEVPKALAERRSANLIVMESGECDWVSGATECSLRKLHHQLGVEVLEVCGTDVHYCVIGRADPLVVYSDAYERGVRDRAEIEGTRSFGLGPGLRCR